MFNGYMDTLWILNKTLAGVSVSLVIAIILFAWWNPYMVLRRNRQLMRIKKNLRALTASGNKVAGQAPSAISETTQDFLDIEMNRETILFSEEERQSIKKHFVSGGNLGHIREAAKKSRRKWHRIEALLSLGYAEDGNALDIIKAATLDKDEDIAYFSILALGAIKTRAAGAALLDILKRNISGAYKIVSILEGFPPEIVYEIAPLLSDHDPKIRSWALRLLARFDPIIFRAQIEKCADDMIADVRAAACECLGKTGEEGAIKVLERLLHDRIWFVRMHAVRALASLGKETCIPAVAKLIRDESFYVKESVKTIIVDHIEKALPVIEEVFAKEEDVIARRELVEALERSGYAEKLFRHLILKDKEKSRTALRLLEGMVRASASFGLDASLGHLTKDDQAKVLEAAKDMNGSLLISYMNGRRSREEGSIC